MRPVIGSRSRWAVLLATSFGAASTSSAQQDSTAQARIHPLGRIALQDSVNIPPAVTGALRYPGAPVATPARSPVVVISRQQRNLLWILPGQGNGTEIRAADTLGHDLGAWRLTNADNSDWTALALGRCDRQTCLYVGDLGDSLSLRGSVQLYRFEEPLLSVDRVSRAYGIPRVQRLDLHYPDGHHDARAMAVEADGSILIATSGREGKSRLYRVPADAWLSGRGSADARAAGSLDLNLERTGAVSGLARWSNRYAVRVAAGLRFLDATLRFATTPSGPASCQFPPAVSGGLGLDWLDEHHLILSTIDQSRSVAMLYAVECPP